MAYCVLTPARHAKHQINKCIRAKIRHNGQQIVYILFGKYGQVFLNLFCCQISMHNMYCDFIPTLNVTIGVNPLYHI